ncbi:MAG: hypothetical protein K1X75_17205 [Leptospirales bacterium]|nr:hypothetical protein [Leptospirales bacterium]
MFGQPEYPPLASEFRRDGMVSSNTYQVHISVFAEDEESALQRGAALARSKAMNLLLQEPMISARISDYGRQEIRRLVDAARVVRVHQESADSWIVVLQVSRRGLRDYLQKLY